MGCLGAGTPYAGALWAEGLPKLNPLHQPCQEPAQKRQAGMEVFCPFEELLKEVWPPVPLCLPILALNVLEKLFGQRMKGENIPQETWNLSFGEGGTYVVLLVPPGWGPDPSGSVAAGRVAS